MQYKTSKSAFTLIELLVVIAIIIALLGLLVGGIGQFSKLSNATATKQMLAGIQSALTNYSLDFKDVPPSSAASGTLGGVNVSGWQGGEIMTQALVAPGASGVDNKNGDGFALNGKEYGPYLELKHSATIAARWDKDNSGGATGGAGELFNTNAPVNLAQRPNAYVLTMASSASKAPFLYYRKQTGVGTFGSKPIYDYSGDKRTTPNTAWVWGTDGLFDVDHNDELVGAFNSTNKSYPNGDNEMDSDFIVKGYWGMPNYDKILTDDDTRIGPSRTVAEPFIVQLRSATYLIVGAGNDDKYGTADDVITTGK